MSEKPLKILAIGAHPDDCDLTAGGAAALWHQDGHEVRFISMTNGASGHHQKSGKELADIRREEAANAGKAIGIQYDVLDNPDGELTPSLEARKQLIGLIRKFEPDLVLTHRPNDYHPDHRYTSQLVCDAAYMVTVPPVVPDVPPLRHNPVICYMMDNFQRPYPFSPTVAIDIEPVLDSVVDMLHCHKSQFYEWLPYNKFFPEPPPEEESQRRDWLDRHYRNRIAHYADQYRDLLVSLYGPERGTAIRYIQAFEPCEYGSPLTEEEKHRLFPFLPK
ncbi:MAG: PIG-L family deacetylase [Planctomycetaceae bacterium]|nr:PIG-L family deacetylase [Planctomycetaceae bacterium]